MKNESLRRKKVMLENVKKQEEGNENSKERTSFKDARRLNKDFLGMIFKLLEFENYNLNPRIT